MKILACLIAIVVLLAPSGRSQQTPPTQTQAQAAPCTTGQPQAANNQNKSGSSLADRWKKKLNDQSAKFGTKAGIPMPTTDDVSKPVTATPAPCTPKAAAPAPVAAAQPATVKLPPDVFVTLRCNPMTPSPQGGAHSTKLTLPDPKDFALPKASDFLADSVVPDTAAKTPCYLVKVDPKTGKSFAQQ